MMRWIVGSSIKFRRLVVAMAAGLMVYGLLQLDNARTDILPEFKRPTVEVQTEALGLSAEEVEQLITVPLEQDLLVGVAFLDEIESASIPGLSSVVMTFEPGTDLLDARQVVEERLTQAVATAGLPEVAKPPQMLQPLSSTSRVAMVKLSSEELTPIEISVLTRWVIAPRLLGVEGIANVAIWGFKDRQLQVLVDPLRLNSEGVTLDQIIRTTGNALEVSPLTFLEASSPGTGGFIDTLNQRLHVFHRQAISTPEELAQVPIEYSGDDDAPAVAPDLTLGDVATVVEDHQPLIGDALCGDEQCVLLVIEKFPEANTPEVTRGLDETLAELSRGLPGMQIDTSIYRPAEYIETSFDNLARALLIGGILLVLVLGALLFEWRSALVAIVAVAASLLSAWLILYLTETTVNAMIVAGLAMALVALIDDAVIDVDNVATRVRKRHAHGDGAPAWSMVLEAILEMRRAILFSTLIVVAVIVPAFFMEGAPGAFLPPIATSYLLAVVASMVVGLTLTAALGMMLLANAPLHRGESRIARAIRRGYDRFAPKVSRSGASLVLVGVVGATGLLTLPFLDPSMRPVLEERDVIVRLQAPPGTSLPLMDEVTAQAVSELGALPEVDNVGAHVGRAIQSDQVVNVNSAEVWVNIDQAADHEEAMDSIRAVAGRLPGVSSRVLTYSEQRVTEVLGRSGDEVVVRIYGEDPEILKSKAEEIRGVIAGIDGVVEPRVDLAADEQTIEVETDIARAEAHGLKPGDVRRAATTLLSGLVVGNLFEEQKVFDVVVWSLPELREGPHDVNGLLIDSPDGGLVTLGEVADVRLVPNPTVIRHESVQSYLDVGADVSGRDVGDVAADIDEALEQVVFPLGHHAEILGGFAEEQAARSRVLVVSVSAAIVAFLLLQAAFSSWRLAAMAFLTVPVGLAGGAVAALLAGGTVSLGSAAGFVAVIAFGTRSAVVLIRHLQLLEREGEPFGADLVLAGTRDRAVPILTSALAAAAALAPFAFGGTSAGFEVVGPMAMVVLGGLVTSTLMTLVALPALYLRFGFVAEPDTSAEDLFDDAVPVTGGFGG